jgi:hypothetical protein
MEIGTLQLRAQLHADFGGNPRAGICPTKSGTVLIFSDPLSGSPFGYDSHDYVLDGVYHYSGEGRVGDQQLLRGNRALLERAPLLLFSRVDQKTWRYVGEVELGEPSYLVAEAPDQNGNLRKVFVFRFVAVSADFELLQESVRFDAG